MKQPGESTWSQAMCKFNKVAPRSYEVQCNGQVYHHNRKDLRPIPDQILPVPTDLTVEPSSDLTSSDEQNESDKAPSYGSPLNETVTSGTPLKVSYHGRVIKPPKRVIKSPKSLIENSDI